MSSSVLLIGLILSQVRPTYPIDGYYANMADTKAKIKYRYRHGFTTKQAIFDLRKWPRDPLVFAEDSVQSRLSEWSSDGSAQHLRSEYEYPEQYIEKFHQSKLNGDEHEDPKEVVFPAKIGIDVLWNNEIQVEYRFGASDIYVGFRVSPGLSLRAHGPTCWWGTVRFTDSLREEFAKLVPSVHIMNINGFSTVVEVYQHDLSSDDWFRMQIYYDPSIGFLPRYVRSVATTHNKTYCKEIYLIDAKPCSAGGFVPLEWYETIFTGDVPTRLLPSELDRSDGPSPIAKVGVGHCKVTSFEDLTQNVSMVGLDSARHINAQGGSISFDPRKALTIASLQSALGKKLTTPRATVMPTLDIEELQKFETAPRGSWLPAMLIAIACFIICGFTARRKISSRFFPVLILPLVCSQFGCNQSQRPIAQVVARFNQSYVVFDEGTASIPLKLSVRDQGNVPLRIFKIDGGCTCRSVDLTGFPITLASGDIRDVPVSLNSSPKAAAVAYRFKFETDNGVLYSEVPIVLLAKHTFHPEAISIASLGERESHQFEITHRSVFRKDEAPDIAMLETSDDFDFEETARHTATVSIAPDQQYQDVKYNVQMNNFNVGLNRSAIRLRSADGLILAEIPVGWRRLEFLSTIPDRIILANKSIRVFIRCKDPTVEFESIVSTPLGTSSHISLPRELILDILDTAPPSISDFLVVSTNDKSKPMIRIPVTRYSTNLTPTTSQEGDR